MFKVLDLFSGIGGFSRGLGLTGGFETVAFCEIEKFPQKVLTKHWPNVPIYEDVRNVTAEQLRSDGIFPNVITGGFPCQDISIAGKGAGINGSSSGLWFEYQRIIADIFQYSRRSDDECRKEVEDNAKLRERDSKERAGERHPFAFFTRQRSDEFALRGLSSTLAKRDYKSYTDIVFEDDYLRRVTPQERMLLQGFPADWMDGLEGKDKELFRCNGMTTNVTQHIGERIISHENTQEV